MSIFLHFICCIFTDFIVYSNEGGEIIPEVNGRISSRGRQITQRCPYRPSFGSDRPSFGSEGYGDEEDQF